MSFFKKFYTQFSHFVTGGSLSLLLGLITFPILTRILSTEQYGILGIVTATMSFFVVLSKAGLSNGIIRFYQQYRNSEEQKTVFASTVIFRGCLIAVVVTILYLAIFPFLSNYMGIDEKFKKCFIIMAAYLFVRPLNIIVLTMLRVNDKTLFLNVLGLVSKIITIILSLSIFVYLIKTISGYFIGVIVVEYLIASVLFYWFFLNYRIDLKKQSVDLTVNLIKFGAPLLMTEMAYLLLSYADRYMLVAWYGEGVLGIYSVGYNLPMYLTNILTFSLAYAVIPVYVEVYETEGKEKTEEFLKKVFHYLIVAVIPICFGYFAIVEDLFVLLASTKYETAASFSPIILLGTFLLEMNNFFNAGLYIKRKSTTIFSIMLISVVVNIVLNVILLPRFSIMGAAMATLISCVLSSVLTISLSFKYIAIRVSVKHVAYYICLSLMMFAAVNQIHMIGLPANVIVKIMTGIVIVIPGILFKEKEIMLFLKTKIAGLHNPDYLD